MDIEQQLHELAKRGLQGLTIFKSDTGYQASLSFDRTAWLVEQGADPATALRKLLASEAPPKPMAVALGYVEDLSEEDMLG